MCMDTHVQFEAKDGMVSMYGDWDVLGDSIRATV